MEEVRSFGYICPKCGKAVLGSRSAFALQAAAARITCECGESELEIQTDGIKFRLWVPCGLCGGTHQAEVDVCRACGVTASRHAEVLTFKLLASRVLTLTGGAADSNDVDIVIG